MHRSVSEPSIGTIGNATYNSATTFRNSRDRVKKETDEEAKDRCGHLWQGKWEIFTTTFLMLPWYTWWQVVVITGILYKYIVHLLRGYFYDYRHLAIIDVLIFLGELIFCVDWIINILHAFWPAVRLHIRVYRRSYASLFYDTISLISAPIILLIYTIPSLQEMENLLVITRFLVVGRIYRIFIFFGEINGTMQKSRFWLFLLENIVTWMLFLHLSTCLWYSSQKPSKPLQDWYSLGYPKHVTAEMLKFDSYLRCFYYVGTRSFNVIFGDSYPSNVEEKLLTITIMIVGFTVIRYAFIGLLAWEIVLDRWRWAKFVGRYHHMLTYLSTCGAPVWLIEQAKSYKQELWNMKNGVLTASQLKELPHSLQTELIFDINVAYLHNSLLFRDTGEAYMRQLSLLMHHEIYLEGQVIWSQGVVKNGMFCIKRGVIEMLSDEDDESPMIAFKDGTVLGELSLFYSIPSKVTVKAATYLELQTLKRTDFMRAMVENPRMLNEVRNKIETRLSETTKRQKAIEAYDKGDSRLIRTRYRPMKLLKDRLAGIDDEDPTFIDDSHLWYKDENNKRQSKFTTEYLELYELSHNVTTVDTPRICLKANFPWILEPDTAFTRMFDIIHFVTVLYVCFIAPLRAIYNFESDTEKVMDCIVTCVLVLNIYLQLTTCIVDKGNRKETVKEIAEVKMASLGFYLDIISVFPIYIFAHSLDPNGETMAPELSKMCVVIQVWHLWVYMQRWERTFDSNVKFLCLCKYGMLLIVLCYWSGCFLYIYSCPKRLCFETSWMARLIFYETKLYVTSDARHERPLTSALAFGTAVFTGSGTADYNPGVSDLLVVTVLVILGTYLYSSYMGEICANYLLSTQWKLKFKESMRELNYFLSVNRVSNKIKCRVTKYFIVQWYYNQAVSTAEIFNDMSANIQHEVLSIEMVKSLLDCPLFQECNRDFLQTLASSVNTVVLPDNEVVQHGADIGRDMYIIQKGHCNVLNCYGNVVHQLGPGDHFGVIEMLYGLPKVYTVITSTNCILRHIEYSALIQSWSTFPESSQAIFLTLQDPDLQAIAASYDDAKPLIGRLDNKTNRIAQEIKESFVVLRDREDRINYINTFDNLGYLRYLRYVFLPLTITPYGIFLKIWCTLRLITAIYYILIIPYNIAVRWDNFYHQYHWVDLFLYMDIIVMGYVAYYDEKSLLIKHPLLTVKRYLKTTFFWDLLAIFPFELVIGVLNDHADKDLCRINRLLLVTRISGAFSFWESDIVRVNPMVVMLKFIPCVIAFVNFMTAIIFMNACAPSKSLAAKESLLVSCKRNKAMLGITKSTNDIEPFWEYIITLFWIFEIFVGTGCTPTIMMGVLDVWAVCILRCTGFLYFAFMFGYIASTCSVTSRSLLEHNENTKDLENFLYQENVDPGLTNKTIKYFEYVWKRTNGSNPQNICRLLNSALMEDTLVFMYEHALREVPLFGKVERSFIRVITQHLCEMYFLKGETVVQCRDMLHDIYIIYKGKVDVLNSYNEMVSCMGPGGMFGNFTGQPVSCSEVSIFASRSLDLLVIPSQTFFNLVKYYPKLKEPLTKAFALSKDYILPITMDNADDSSEEFGDSEDADSAGSGFESKTGSSRFELTTAGQLSMRSSHSNVSQAKSSVSVSTLQGYMHISNILRPGTWLYQGYGYLTCFMATASYVCTLYEIVTLNNCIALFWIQSGIDVFFYIKMYFNIHRGYVNKRGEFVTSPSRCRERYFKHKKWMWADILVNLPFELLGFCFPTPWIAIHFFRANKLFRLVYLVEFYKSTAAELTNNFTALQTATTALVVILLLHSGSCLWLITMVASQPTTIIRNVKTHLIDEAQSAEGRGSTMEEIMQNANMNTKEPWDYVTSFYVVVAELTSTGGDEFQINTIVPLAILSAVLVCGKMLAALVVATSIQIAYSTKHALTKYERKVNKLMDMLKNQGLSEYQMKKFWKYVTQLWVSERGRQLPVLLTKTPYVRRCDLMSAMFGHNLRNCYVFSDTGEAFLRQLTAVLEYTVIFPGNYIVSAGDIEARMYWVTSGTVSVLSVRSDLTETTHEHLGTGDVFGILQGLSRGIPHVFSYRAESKVSILTLTLDSWKNILKFFPEAAQIIYERSEYLYTQIDIV